LGVPERIGTKEAEWEERKCKLNDTRKKSNLVTSKRGKGRGKPTPDAQTKRDRQTKKANCLKPHRVTPRRLTIRERVERNSISTFQSREANEREKKNRKPSHSYFQKERTNGGKQGRKKSLSPLSPLNEGNQLGNKAQLAAGP